jgi:enoyl-CoA hydratase/carnithine racemase
MSDFVVTEIRGQVGCITLTRAKALNALNLDMVRSLTSVLLQWQANPEVKAVAIRGTSKAGTAGGEMVPFGALCAGGDIRFFHQAALTGSPELEDFFTEEYRLNYLIHNYSKPYIAFMDGIVMGGGMGISQGALHRIVTSGTKMAMPETHIGLFPDVGGGYFLSRCPGRLGEWLALTGEILGGPAAMTAGLADACFEVSHLEAAWNTLADAQLDNPAALERWLAMYSIAGGAYSIRAADRIDQYFSLPTVVDILAALEAAGDEWAQQTAATLRKRSPLMLHVVLEQVRRARTMTLADDLRMERDIVRHCFNTVHLGRSGATSETVEGIRALAVDKDHAPKWNPARVEDVDPEQVAPFFVSPWPAWAHPLRDLA